ncbi:MAG: hypothetical protein EBZ48_12550, partial [Proteobacteria bacterium]|nr:hypothetical protein [Pseudomonadota bacterium]
MQDSISVQKHRTAQHELAPRRPALFACSWVALGGVMSAVCCIAVFLFPNLATAQEAAPRKSGGVAKAQKARAYDPDPRGEPEVTLCSQNLQNLGTYSQSKARLFNITPEEFDQKRQALVRRFKETGCDIIAVQELLGRSVEEATETLAQLAKLLGSKTNRLFDVVAAESSDPLSRVGFIYARDRVEVQNKLSYARLELPRLTPKERPRQFIRPPMELQFAVKPREEGVSKVLTVINFHLKSKAGKERDPVDLEWETYRMQMAEALRRVAENRHAASFASGEALLAIVGDRNSNFDAASARILEGSLVLQQFEADPACRLTKRGFPICKAGGFRPSRLFSVITGDPTIR